MKSISRIISVTNFINSYSIRLMISILLLFISSEFLFSQVYWGNEMLPDYSETLTNGEFSTLYPKKTVDIEDSLMYIVDYYGITIANISNPANPQILSRMQVHGTPKRVLVRNKTVFILEFFGFTIIDASNPTNPNIASYYEFNIADEEGADITLSGNYLFLSSYQNIYAFDVSNIHNPTFVSTLFLLTTNYGIHITKHPVQPYLYCAANGQERTLFVVNISNPSNMTITATISLDGGTFFSSPEIVDSSLFVLETIKIHKFNISDPANPLLIYSRTPYTSHYSFVVKDTLFFAAHQQSKWVVYSVANDSAPIFLTQYLASEEWGNGFGITKLYDKYIFLINYGRGLYDAGWNIKIVDISNPLNASIIGVLNSPFAGFSVSHKIIERENTKYALVIQRNTIKNLSGGISYQGLLRILNVSDPYNPEVISTLELNNEPLSIDANDSLAFITAWTAGYPDFPHFLYVVALGDLRTPIITQTINLDNSTIRADNMVKLFEDRLYVLDKQKLNVYSINNDYTISLIGSSSINVANPLMSMEFRRMGNQIYAYLAAGGGPSQGGFVIANVTNPNQIYAISIFDTHGLSYDIEIQDNYAYLSDYTSLWIFDISNNQTQPVSNIPVSDGVSTYLKVLNNLLFVLINENSSVKKHINVYDISNPLSPVYKGKYLSKTAENFTLSDNGKFFYLSNKYSFNIKRPLFNFKPSTFNLLLPADSAVVSDSVEFVWSQAYDANDDTLTYRLHIWNSSTDTTFTVIGDTSVVLNLNLFLEGNYKWTVEVSDKEFQVASKDTFSFRCLKTGISDNEKIPNNYALYQNYPNPFNPVTNIKFDLKKESNVSLTIFNPLGELVWEKDIYDLPAGTHKIEWNGTDKNNRQLSSGFYVLRMIVNGREDNSKQFEQSIKMILLK